jgi:hypothetical protein
MNDSINKFSTAALSATKEDTTKYPEVFARLIINECIKACLDVYKDKINTYRPTDNSFNEGYEIASIQCIKNIKDMPISTSDGTLFISKLDFLK